MWNVYVGAGRAAVYDAAASACCFHAAGETIALISECMGWMAGRKRWRTPRASVWLSGALARPFMIGPVGGLKSWAEAQAFAHATAPTACGLIKPAPPALSGWPQARPVLAIATEQQLLDELNRIASACQVRLAAVRPWWALACNLVCRQAGDAAGLIVREDDALTVLAAADSRWTAASWCAPEPDEAATRALELRLMVACGLDEAGLARAAWVGNAHERHWPCIDWQDGDRS